MWVGELIVVIGPPGAGKTTVSRILSHLFEPSARISGDEFFGFIEQGYLAPWTAAAHHQNEIVIGAAAAAAGRLAGGGYTVIYDGVIGPWFLDAFGQATGLPRLHYAVCCHPSGCAWTGSHPGSGTASPTLTQERTCTPTSPKPILKAVM